MFGEVYGVEVGWRLRCCRIVGENGGWRVDGGGVDTAVEREIFITLRDTT